MGGFGQTTGTTQKQLEQLFLFFLQIGWWDSFRKK
jgi:hypothetical protein